MLPLDGFEANKETLTLVVSLIYVAVALVGKDMTLISSYLRGTYLILSCDDAGKSAQPAGKDMIVVGNATRGKTSRAFRSIQIIAGWLGGAVFK